MGATMKGRTIIYNLTFATNSAAIFMAELSAESSKNFKYIDQLITHETAIKIIIFNYIIMMMCLVSVSVRAKLTKSMEVGMMEVLNWMQNAALFACPLVAYILLFKGRHKHKNQQSHYSIPYWNFFLKKWWVRWTIWRLHPYTRHAVVSFLTAFMPSQQDEVIETPRMLIGDKEVDSMMISGTDHKGSAVHLRITRKHHSEIQIWLYVQLENGSVFLLPEHPDSTLISMNKNSWVGGGLKFQVCEPLRKWRISFNGLLRHVTSQKGNFKNKKDNIIKHVCFSFIWTACSDVIDVQKDWSTTLRCDAIAREPWRSAAWMKMRKQMGEGYDQWGTLHGTWRSVDDDAEPRELYLRGIRRRRYGTDEAVYLRRSVSYGGVATDGTMFSIEARSCEKPGLTHAVFGHVYQPNGCHALVSSCDLLLPNHGEYPESIPKHAILRFTAGGRNYTCTVHTAIDTAAAVHGGRPWHYEAHIIPFRCNLNMKQGAGTAVFWYRYSGTSPVLLSLSRPLLREPQLKYEGPMALVVDFRDKQCASSSLVGGKGASLGLMTSVKTQKLGAEIPAGFCLTVEALYVQMQEFHQLQQAITTLQLVSSVSTELSDIQEQCSRTVTLFESTPVCETVSFEVLRHLQRLLRTKSKPQLFAVRSSAVGEDSEDLSAAGQNATLLGVHGELSDILEAIQKCWASLYTFQSLQYRRQHGQRVQVDMGVVIQQMVAADKAGVLFTWHPTTGDPRQMLITANFGLGESVVSAQVEPDTILLTRDRAGYVAIKETKCGRKSHKVAVSAAGVMAELLESDKVYQLCLTTPEALALGKLGVHLEQMFGDPRDIEWAISEDKIYLLQARPITSLNSWSDFELLHEFDSPIITDTEVLTTANIGEVFPGAVTPLSQSITFRSADLATRQGLPYRPGYHYASNIVTTSYHGMINVLNTMLRSIGEEIQLADKVIDLAIYGHPVTSMKFFRLAIERNGALNSLGKISLVLKILTDIILKGRVIRRAKKLSSEFSLDYEGHNSAKSLYNYISNNLHILAKVAECHGYTSRIGLFAQAVAITVLTEGNEDLTEDHYHDMGLLLSSCSDVVSAEIPAALEDLATSIAATGKAAAFCKVKPSQAVTWLSKNCPIVAIKLNGFLNKHGHRCIKELELMVETWCMQPEGLMKTVQTMLMSSTGGEHHNYTKNNVSDETLLASLKSVKKPSTRIALGWLLSMCRSTVAGREANKDYYINVTHKLRQAYRHLAGLMVKEGRIPDPQLLFFFSHYELGLLLSTRDPILIIKAQRRRRLYSQWERLTFPEINMGIPVSLPSVVQVESKNGRSRLKGTAVCPGTVMGRACVITNLEQINKLKQNDILITHSTDVGWSPYFPLLAGIVTELGGLISHGAVVAREYGLPCIVGCQDATRIFATGDTVLLVGAMGTLEKIDSSTETTELLTETVC